MFPDSTSPGEGFAPFGFAAPIMRGIAACGFVQPRPIQAQTIPAAMRGADVLGLAQTGTGKTAAFVLPILQKLLSAPAPGPRALVIAPTRELAAQIHAEASQLSRFTRIKIVSVFGGVSAAPQIRALRENPEIIVACPGRLLDLQQQGHVKLSRVEILVLDEADHMFDLGFLPSVRRIIKLLPAQRQNLLFSATMPAEVRTLTGEVLRKPHIVELAHSKPAHTVKQTVCRVASDRKMDVLRHLLKEDGFTSAIVFLRTKHRAKRVARQLSQLGHDAVALEGNMSQSQRERAMSGFREGRFDVLVATDIAARGIDVANVSHVINFDVPNTPEAYTHRVGRTGRAGKQGKAITLVGDEDHATVRNIERKLGAPLPSLRLEGFETQREAARPQPLRLPTVRSETAVPGGGKFARTRRSHFHPGARRENRERFAR